LAAAGIRMNLRAKGTRRKEHGLQKQKKEDTAPRTPKGRTCRTKLGKDPACKFGIEDPDIRRRMRLKIERRSEEIDRKVFEPQLVKRATTMCSGLRRVQDWTLWRGRPPPKRKKRQQTEQKPVM
jgi:hypothetical protein